jgi:hypothetical protein
MSSSYSFSKINYSINTDTLINCRIELRLLKHLWGLSSMRR